MPRLIRCDNCGRETLEEPFNWWALDKLGDGQVDAPVSLEVRELLAGRPYYLCSLRCVHDFADRGAAPSAAPGSPPAP